MNKIKTVKIKNEDSSVDQEVFHISQRMLKIFIWFIDKIFKRLLVILM